MSHARSTANGNAVDSLLPRSWNLARERNRGREREKTTSSSRVIRFGLRSRDESFDDVESPLLLPHWSAEVGFFSLLLLTENRYSFFGNNNEASHEKLLLFE